jgi:hypothetical protein
MGLAGVVENPLGRRRLAGIDVRHDADVAVIFDFSRAGHSGCLAKKGCSEAAERTARAVYLKPPAPESSLGGWAYQR